MDPSNMSGHEGMEMNTPGEMTGMNMDSTSTGHNHGIK
jgi:hypothetical protein